VLKTLVGLGLTRLDSQVYIYLAKRGPQKGQDLSKGLKVQKQQLYRSLKNLESKGIVSATLEHPARFTAVSFDKVVDIFVKSKMAEAHSIQENKDEILANWQAIAVGEPIDATAKFNIIEGRGPIYAKILQMMKETQNQLSTITTVIGLFRVDQFGLFEAGIGSHIKSKIRFRALTELSKQNMGIAKKLIKDIIDEKINFEGRTPDLSLNLPQMVIKDEEEILFFITPGTNATQTEQEDMCLWTNCKSLVQAFTAVFEDFWRNSTTINAKIAEIETGKPAPKTQIIDDAETASRKFNETVQAAEKEITMITSSKGLIEIWKNKPLLNQWVQKGVAVKIMAPVTSENIEAVQQLSKQCEVKHIPVGYLGTAIIDGKHLFQLKTTPQDYGTFGSKFSFENTFYTNDFEYVEKTRIMLNDVWRNAQTPSTNTLKSISSINSQTTSPISDHPVYKATQKMANLTTIEDEETSGQLTEKVVIDKIIKAQKCPATVSKGIVKTYSTNSQAIIHPPSHLNLPDILLHTYHMEKHSTYGAEDAMLIHMWSNTPKGYFTCM
jgi:sugar-specific transcriptional regulator TrmB